MKKSIKSLMMMLSVSILLTSCYSYTSVVGEGANGNNTVTEKNHYIIYGLGPIKTSDSKKMANGAQNYTVKTEQSFIDGLISAITCGIYTPTTTTVTK